MLIFRGVRCFLLYLLLVLTFTTLTDKTLSLCQFYCGAIGSLGSGNDTGKQTGNFGNADGNMEMIYSIHICSEINFCNNWHAIHHFHELTGPFPYFNAEGHSLKSLKAYFLVFVFLERKKSTFLHGDHVQIGVFICSLVPVPSGIVHTKQMSMLFTYSAIHFLGRIDFPTTKKSRKSWIHKGKNPETLASALQMY